MISESKQDWEKLKLEQEELKWKRRKRKQTKGHLERELTRLEREERENRKQWQREFTPLEWQKLKQEELERQRWQREGLMQLKFEEREDLIRLQWLQQMEHLRQVRLRQMRLELMRLKWEEAKILFSNGKIITHIFSSISHLLLNEEQRGNLSDQQDIWRDKGVRKFKLQLLTFRLVAGVYLLPTVDFFRNGLERVQKVLTQFVF